MLLRQIPLLDNFYNNKHTCPVKADIKARYILQWQRKQCLMYVRINITYNQQRMNGSFLG
jgi:hypothetical protein